MIEEKLTELLRAAGLKRTPIRVAVLKHLAEINHAVSQADLETIFENRENRVTIYRVLRDLEEKGLTHRVFDMAGTTKFALCNHANCTSHKHQDEHLHFNCRVCNHVFCIENIKIPFINMPEGFEIESLNLTVQGICKNCNQ